MRKTYKCSNIKFCMEDENQRRTWEYLQSITRKDGSYGKIRNSLIKTFQQMGFAKAVSRKQNETVA